MGLFDFVKDAGSKLLGVNDAEANEDKVAALSASVKEMGFPVENLQVGFTDGVASVAGKVASQEVKEKIVLTVGNTKGVAQVNDLMKVEKPEPEAKMYTVKSGDSLSKISKEFYGDPMKYNHIFEANKPMLKNPDLIYPGQMLRIPNL